MSPTEAKAGPHHANAARLFPSVYMVFFPFVVLSDRAIGHLYQLRLSEGRRNMPTADRVFCEAMVASALITDDSYRTADLNELIEGSYARRSFYWGVPMLHRHETPEVWTFRSGIRSTQRGRSWKRTS
jgi:hypothetical protein